MAEILTSSTNGHNFAYKHTVTADDASDGYVEIDFQTDRVLVPNVMVASATDIFIDLADAVITIPSTGAVRITNGAATFTLVAGQKIYLVCSTDSSVYTF